MNEVRSHCRDLPDFTINRYVSHDRADSRSCLFLLVISLLSGCFQASLVFPQVGCYIFLDRKDVGSSTSSHEWMMDTSLMDRCDVLSRRHQLLPNNRHVDGDAAAEIWPPPVPPIPDNAEMSSWQRRSIKRSSAISQHFGLLPTTDAIIQHADNLNKSWDTTSMRPQSTYYAAAQRVKISCRPSVFDSTSVIWEDHPKNPRRWRSSFKWLHAVSACKVIAANMQSHLLTSILVICTFTISLASSIDTPLYLQYQDQYDLTTFEALLPHSLFLLGLSFAPITTCLRNRVGRKALSLTTHVLFAMFTTIATFAGNYPTIVGAKLLAGIAASASFAFCPAVLLDVFAAGQRTTAFTLYALTITVGTTLGPLLASVILTTHSLQWIGIALLICIGISLATCLFTRETSQELLALRQQQASVSQTVSQAVSQPPLTNAAASVFKRSFEIIAHQRGVWAAMLTFAIISAISSSLLQNLSRTFESVYQFGLVVQGCLPLSFLCGCCVAGLVLTAFHHVVYIPKRMRWEECFLAQWEKHNRSKNWRGSRARSRTVSVGKMAKPQMQALRQESTISQRGLVATAAAAAASSIPSTAAPIPTPTPTALTAAYMNPGLAVAIAGQIDLNPATQGRYISAEDIWAVSNRYNTFEQMLVELEQQYDLQLDRVEMAYLHSAWSKSGPRASAILTAAPDVSQVSVTLDGSSTHHAATLAALEQSETRSTLRTSTSTRNKRSLYFNAPLLARQRPPAEWRLTPALPGAVLSTAGMFLLAWTTTTKISWMIPMLGLAIFGCGAFLAATSTCLYLTDRYGSTDVVHAFTIISSVSYLAGFAFSLLSVMLYDGVDAGWATSVLGFCSLGLCAVALFRLRADSDDAGFFGDDV